VWQRFGNLPDLRTPADSIPGGMSRPAARQSVPLRRRSGKVILFFASLFLFILAIILMKAGAGSLTPLVQERLHVNTPVRSLGFGWLFAYVILSGSPVAAVALTLLDAGALTPAATFTMITGSRLGASFIVFAIGFLYVLRGRSRSASMSMGLLSLTVTGTTFLVALPVGLLMLERGWLRTVSVRSGPVLTSLFAVIFDPIVAWAAARFPTWGLFLMGLGIIMMSFALFDRCLPEMSIKESQIGRTARLVYRPWVMFLLGAAVTLISMSVSISLGILVPLSDRGFVRRENVIPYIMGANVTTFIDTVLAALLLDNPVAFTVILAEMASILIISALVLTLVYRRYEHAVLDFVGWCTASRRNLGFFTLAIFAIPIVLVLL
jgi:Na+/phosphate symporter